MRVRIQVGFSALGSIFFKSSSYRNESSISIICFLQCPMKFLSVPTTMVSMAVFVILIGLGIGYSIQFHNGYEEEITVKRTMSQIGKSVAIAVFATVLGFALVC